MKKYDYLIVGAGLFGSVFAEQMTKKSKKCLVIDKRAHIGGNIFTEEIEGIQVHRYGAHIFHTSDKEVWDYVNRFAEFNRYTNEPLANFNGKLYHLPFNMNTFYEMWGTVTPEEAKKKIASQIENEHIQTPRNLEEQALSMVGRDIYEALVSGYTAKQWGRPCNELPSFIIKRLPVRFTYNNNYFNDKYQGIPIGGYTAMIEKMLKNCDVRLKTDFFKCRKELENEAENILFTGMIDEYYNYCYGPLQYRSLQFETEVLNISDYQGNAVVNYTDRETPFTRIIEHKHFDFGKQEKTVITKEYPSEWEVGKEPFYPINDEKNSALYEKYKALADKETNVIFGGRLGTYRYWDMHIAIKEALMCADNTK